MKKTLLFEYYVIVYMCILMGLWFLMLGEIIPMALGFIIFLGIFLIGGCPIIYIVHLRNNKINKSKVIS